jgi:periplasmic protein TonB
MASASPIHQLVEPPVPVQRDPRRKIGTAASQAEPREITPYVAQFDLSQSLIEANQMKRPRGLVDMLISVVLHVVVIGTPIFLSLWYTNTLDLKAYTQTMLVGPPPPPPPPPAPSVPRSAAAPRHVLFDKGKLLAPSYVPQQVAMLKEAPLPEDGNFGVEGGVPGGVPGGQMGGVIGGILGGFANSNPAAPAPVKSKIPIRVGGHVQAPRAIYTPAPVYPSLARATKMQGTVIISAILDESGNVVEMKVVSGPVLLYQAALAAVATWRYQPTYLNGVPISVEMNILVNFQLTQ